MTSVSFFGTGDVESWTKPQPPPQPNDKFISSAMNTTLNVTGGYGTGGDPQHFPTDGLNYTASATAIVWTGPVIQRVATIIVLMIMALVGNCLIIVVLTCSSTKKRFSRVNFFILHLAIGDLLVCVVTMSTEIMFVAFGQWVLGEALCKLIVYGQIVTLASTTFILTALSFDRFIAITRPLNVNKNSTTAAKKTIALAWVLSFLFAVPQLFIFVQEERQASDGTLKYACVSQGYSSEWQRKVYVTWLAVYVLVCPSTIISYCYIKIIQTVWRTASGRDHGRELRRTGCKTISRAKVKTIKMTLCIIIGFVTCWTPYFVVTLYEVFTGRKLPEVAYVVAETMALFNSTFNPIVYGCFSLNLKQGLIEIFCAEKLKGKTRRRPTPLLTDEVMLTHNRSSQLRSRLQKRLRNKKKRELSIASKYVRSSNNSATPAVKLTPEVIELEKRKHTSPEGEENVAKVPRIFINCESNSLESEEKQRVQATIEPKPKAELVAVTVDYLRVIQNVLELESSEFISTFGETTNVNEDRACLDVPGDRPDMTDSTDPSYREYESTC
ncbi:gonadotropin-releasing hormone receptor-like isoform X1 [Branchiostoma lanceolatum]|uniref:gonadotropin-releasing hormone receptor-like isoform X1 n=2 Tax=Branchiostoma lanceolatum TaxID=7740 RepID=UPI001133036D